MAALITGVHVGPQGSQVYMSSDWAQLTLCTASTGISVASDRSMAADGQGFPLPVDRPVNLIVGPGTTLWCAGDDGAIVGIAEQPLPWNLAFIDGLATILGEKIEKLILQREAENQAAGDADVF